MTKDYTVFVEWFYMLCGLAIWLQQTIL